jgi:hypothetical protein
VQKEIENLKRRKIGYCNPPEHTRFKKGQSGNAAGRPRNTPNLATTLAKVLREEVVLVADNGKRKVVTRLEAAVDQLTVKAAAGELGAIKLLNSLIASTEERAVASPATDAGLQKDDQKVLQGILKRLMLTKEKE